MAQTIKNGEHFETMTGKLKDLTTKVSDQMESGEIDGARIGKIPTPGEVVEINGLQWKVERTDSEQPRMTLKLV